jgi:hypothetical protein
MYVYMYVYICMWKHWASRWHINVHVRWYACIQYAHMCIGRETRSKLYLRMLQRTRCTCTYMDTVLIGSVFNASDWRFARKSVAMCGRVCVCMYVCLYTSDEIIRRTALQSEDIYIHIYAFMYVCTHTHTYIDTPTHTHVCIYIYTYMYMYMIRTYKHAYIAYIHTYTSMQTHTLIHNTYTHIHAQTATAFRGVRLGANQPRSHGFDRGQTSVSCKVLENHSGQGTCRDTKKWHFHRRGSASKLVQLAAQERFASLISFAYWCCSMVHWHS